MTVLHPYAPHVSPLLPCNKVKRHTFRLSVTAGKSEMNTTDDELNGMKYFGIGQQNAFNWSRFFSRIQPGD